MGAVVSGFFKDVIYDMLKTGAKQAICQGLATSEAVTNGIYAAYEDFVGLDLPSVNIPGIARGLLCDKPSSPRPGQNNLGVIVPCVCDRYEITYRLELENGSNLGTSKFTVFGEIAGFRIFPTTGSATGGQVFCRGAVPGGGCRPGLEWVQLPGGTGAGGVSSVNVLSIRNLSNPQNNCGQPPTPTPVPVPDGGIQLPDVQIIYNPVFGDTITNNVNITPTLLRPYFNIENELEIPINLNTDIALDFGTLNVDARINLSTGDVTINLPGLQGRESPGGGGVAPRLPGGEGGRVPRIIDPIPPVPEGVPNEGENPERNRRLVGVMVRTSNAPIVNRLTEIPQDSNPAIYVPSLGHVNFLYEIGRDNPVRAWSEDFRVKNQNHFIPVPSDIRAIDYGATPQPGIEWSVTPVYE